MTDKPATPPTQSGLTTNKTTTLDTQRKPGVINVAKGLHARLQSPTVTTQLDANTKPNRIALMLDASGSMSGNKIESLREACQSFVQNCNFGDTALALETFGAEPEIHIALTCQQPLLMMTAMSLAACGNTPMATTMDYTLNSYSITRGVIVSDGQPDSETATYGVAMQYKEAGIPVDCVHIGTSVSGEACLQRIAEITGGKFIKFTDIASFSKNFKYLTPAYYAQLTSGGASAAMLGAKEIK